MMLTISCAEAIGHLPSAKALLAINIIIFGGALIAVVIALSALCAVRSRRRAADPYAQPFGDEPSVVHMRAWRPRR